MNNFNLIGKAHDKEFWKSVRNDPDYRFLIDGLLAIYEKDCDTSIDELLYSEFKLFKTTGDRGVFEKPYFKRRRALSALSILSLIYPDEEKYLDGLMDVIYAICNEYTWCLPAHQPNIDALNEIYIDLFAAETGFALSEIYTLLSDRLEPLINARIKCEVKRRILDSFANKDAFSWENGKSNWTAVCMGSVACTFMLMAPELYERFEKRFDSSFEAYLSGFENDGICTEGCAYWHYGFGFFTVYADMVRRFTDGATDYFKREKVKTVSSFIQKMFLSGNSCVSFSDGGRGLSYHLGLLHRLKDEYGGDISVFPLKYSYINDNCARYCLHLSSFIWFNKDYAKEGNENSFAPIEFFARESSWFVKRTSSYGFAAKGGHNDEPHNHNDVGSFIFAKSGKQILCDIGSGKYTRQYFQPATRYEHLECSSRSHSVPIIDGKYQKEGASRKASLFEYENGRLTTEFSGAYDIPYLEKIERSFTFTKDSVSISDEIVCSANAEITDRLVTLCEPVIKEGEIILGDAILTYDDCSPCSVTSEVTSGGTTVYMLDFKITSGKKFTYTIK